MQRKGQRKEADVDEMIKKVRNGFDFDVLKSQTMEGFAKANEIIQQIGEEARKVHQPKERKDVKIKGEAVSKSLTVDSRVFIQFPSESSAKEHYELLQDMADHYYWWQEYRKLPWYKRIFK